MTYPNIPTAATATALQEIMDELGDDLKGNTPSLSERLTRIELALGDALLTGHGSGRIAIGAGATPVGIAHGLDFIPLIGGINITSTTPLITATQYAVLGVSDTHFTVGLFDAAGVATNQATADWTFDWSVAGESVGA